MMEADEIKKLAFWADRAKLGDTAGTNDFVLKELELDVIRNRVASGSHVLDAGCGNGATLVLLASLKRCSGVGLDFSPEMLRLARETSEKAGVSNLLAFKQGRIEDLRGMDERFDCAITERSLQNLNSVEEQEEAFSAIMDRLRTGGQYLMIESFTQGVEKTNAFRAALGLEPIEPPWHNLFLDEDRVRSWQTPVRRLEEVFHFSSTYYFLSRVVYAKLARDGGEPLRYDSAINRIGQTLPPVGDFGPTRLFQWRKWAP